MPINGELLEFETSSLSLNGHRVLSALRWGSTDVKQLTPETAGLSIVGERVKV